MATQVFPLESAPLPETLADAIEEIKRLRSALIQSNERWGEAVVRAWHQRKALRDDIKYYRQLLGLE